MNKKMKVISNGPSPSSAMILHFEHISQTAAMVLEQIGQVNSSVICVYYDHITMNSYRRFLCQVHGIKDDL